MFKGTDKGDFSEVSCHGKSARPDLSEDAGKRVREGSGLYYAGGIPEGKDVI